MLGGRNRGKIFQSLLLFYLYENLIQRLYDQLSLENQTSKYKNKEESLLFILCILNM